MLLERILSEIKPNTVIPKPAARGDFRIKGVGHRRGEPALIYTIPNHNAPNRPYEKGINASELDAAYRELIRTGRLTRAWFDQYLKSCASEGPCNFTTIGGLLVLLGEAEYAEPGVYRRQPGPCVADEAIPH
jgi:hypothetical protein